jgi:hypothetical protein
MPAIFFNTTLPVQHFPEVPVYIAPKSTVQELLFGTLGIVFGIATLAITYVHLKRDRCLSPESNHPLSPSSPGK